MVDNFFDCFSKAHDISFQKIFVLIKENIDELCWIWLCINENKQMSNSKEKYCFLLMFLCTLMLWDLLTFEKLSAIEMTTITATTTKGSPIITKWIKVLLIYQRISYWYLKKMIDENLTLEVPRKCRSNRLTVQGTMPLAEQMTMVPYAYCRPSQYSCRWMLGRKICFWKVLRAHREQPIPSVIVV